MASQAQKLYYDRSLLQVRLSADLPKEEQVHPRTPIEERMLRVVSFWNDQVMDDQLYTPGEPVSIGRSLKNDFVIPTIGLPARYNLITSKDGQYTLRLPEVFTGLVQVKDKMLDVQKDKQALGTARRGGIREVDLSVTDRGVLEIGYLGFYFDFVPIPPDLAREKSASRVDPFFMRLIMYLLILFLVFQLTMLIIPKRERDTIEDVPDRFAKEILQPKVVKKQTLIKLRMQDWGQKPKPKRKKSQGKQGQGARRAGKEGKRDRINPSRKGVVTKQRSVDQAGLLEVFSKSRKYSALSDILGGEGGLGQNVDKHFRPGGSTGKGDRWARGTKGTGPGGGGTARTGIGGLGTKGRGTGKSGYGLSDIGTKGESAVTAVIEESETYVMGSLDRQAILKVILNNLRAIQYCYERQLTQTPNLKGKVVVNFVIAGNGRVSSSNVIQSSMGSRPVESCVASRIRRLIFPKPPYGIVEVKFPFIFRSGG